MLKDLERIFQAAFATFGRIDTLVVNAGGAVEGTALATVAAVEKASFDRYMDLNLKSSHFTVQKALPYFNGEASAVECNAPCCPRHEGLRRR